MSLEAKALQVRPAHDINRTQNDFGAMKIDVLTTHAAAILPATWSGRYVIVDNTHATAIAEIAFSTKSDGEVDTGVSATAAGATGKVGMRVLPAVLHPMPRFLLPKIDPPLSLYIITEASAQLTLKLHIADGP